MNGREQNRAFSLVELVIVLVIIGVIAAIAVPRLTRGATNASATALAADLAALRNAVELYRAEHEGAFPTVAGFVNQMTLFSDTAGTSTAAAADVGNGIVYGPYLKGIPALPVGAKKGSTAKDPHVMFVDGVYLIYYVVMDKRGYCSCALSSTTDWRTFSDEGPVIQVPPMLRGTMGIESPAVVHRDGMWHLFFTYGPGLWHAVSRTPQQFVQGRGPAFNVGTGYYLMGPFHATEVVRDAEGEWWLTADRKEETRWLNRKAGRLCYRGSYEDEKTLEEGLYLSHIRWAGDQPILEKPAGRTPSS